jgi:hypothetical protein
MAKKEVLIALKNFIDAKFSELFKNSIHLFSSFYVSYPKTFKFLASLYLTISFSVYYSNSYYDEIAYVLFHFSILLILHINYIDKNFSKNYPIIYKILMYILSIIFIISSIILIKLTVTTLLGIFRLLYRGF